MFVLSGKPRAKYYVKIDGAARPEIDRLANLENISTNEYVRRHIDDLLQKGWVFYDDSSRMQAPNIFYPDPPPRAVVATDDAPNPPQDHYMFSQRGYYNPYRVAPPPSRDELDDLVSTMKKMVTVKMMKGLIHGEVNPEHFAQAVTSRQAMDDISIEKLLKYKTLMNFNEPQKESEMTKLMQQYMIAQMTGDKGKGDKTLEMMMAMFANQSAQAQIQSTNQNNLFANALNMQRETNEAKLASSEKVAQRTQDFQTQMANVSQGFMQQVFNMQIQQQKAEMERIRNDKSKSPLDQLALLVSMRDSSPVYKAAFNAALGVKDESMVGKLLPQLKEWGVDKVVEKVGSALVGLAVKPPAPPAPSAIPMPGSPAGAPADGLENLSLFPQATPPESGPIASPPMLPNSGSIPLVKPNTNNTNNVAVTQPKPANSNPLHKVDLSGVAGTLTPSKAPPTSFKKQPPEPEEEAPVGYTNLTAQRRSSKTP